MRDPKLGAALPKICFLSSCLWIASFPWLNLPEDAMLLFDSLDRYWAIVVVSLWGKCDRDTGKAYNFPPFLPILIIYFLNVCNAPLLGGCYQHQGWCHWTEWYSNNHSYSVLSQTIASHLWCFGWSLSVKRFVVCGILFHHLQMFMQAEQNKHHQKTISGVM